MSTPLAIVIAALEARGCNGFGRSWQCPAHKDCRVSLSILEGSDGKVLLRCFAGCEVEAIVSALGLKMADLFPPKVEHPIGDPRPDLAQASAYIAALTGSLMQSVTFQTFDDKGKDKTLTRVLHGSLDGLTETLTRLNDQGAGIFITVNETDLQGRKRENVVKVRALFVDADGPMVRPFAVEPSFRVESSPGRSHAYWSVTGDAALEGFAPAQKQLIAYYQTDPGIHDLPRVMRTPGFWHRKGAPSLVRFIPGTGHAFSVAELLEAHPVTSPPKPETKKPTLVREAPADRTEALIRIVREKADARAWTEGSRHASAKATAAHARKLGLPDDAILSVVLDYLTAAGKGAEEADSIVKWTLENVTVDPDEIAPPVRIETKAGAKGKAPTVDDRESAAQTLIRIGEANSFLFHDERETAHAAIGTDDARRIVSIKSDVFTKFLCGRFYAQTGKGANGEAVATARNVLASKAIFDGPRHVLQNRFAWHEGALWIDLADAKHRAARVTAEGWTLETPPIIFRSFKRQAPLPEPRDGGDLRKLLNFVNVASDGDRVLLLTWTALAVLGHIPRPILDIHGSQGGGKSTAAKMVRRLTDPSAAGTNHLSNRDEELALTFETNAVPYFDNLTHLSSRQAELLCQAVTGGGFSKRELFTDSDEILYDFKRAIILTGINVPTVAPDLLDRFLMIQLERVSREKRATESKLWLAFDEAAPALFGGLLSVVSSAMLRHPRIVNEAWQLERMADWCLWGLALAESIGTTPTQFKDAYQRNVDRQLEEVLEADPVARAVRELVQRERGFSDTASALFDKLKEKHGEEIKAKDSGWPKRSDGLSRRLRVLASSLSDAGISVRWTRTGEKRDRIITLEAVGIPETASGAPNASVPPDATDAMDAMDAENGIPTAGEEEVA